MKIKIIDKKVTYIEDRQEDPMQIIGNPEANQSKAKEQTQQ